MATKVVTSTRTMTSTRTAASATTTMGTRTIPAKGMARTKTRGRTTRTSSSPPSPPRPPSQAAELTRISLTPAASTPVTTGTLVVALRVCPDGIDPAIGTAELARACTEGKADARFELSGRSGIYTGWHRDITTDDGGDGRVASLAQGTYSLTLGELDWCAAEASSVSDGRIVVNAGETTEVTAYLCGDDPSTPVGS
jgi:hypothetical protein